MIPEGKNVRQIFRLLFENNDGRGFDNESLYSKLYYMLPKRPSNLNIELDEVALELVHDFRNTPVIICVNGVYAVRIDEKSIGLASMEKEYFMQYVAPILDTNQTKLYFSNFNSLYPAFDYFSFDRGQVAPGDHACRNWHRGYGLSLATAGAHATLYRNLEAA